MIFCKLLILQMAKLDECKRGLEPKCTRRIRKGLNQTIKLMH